jgi:hypothetical protein
MRVPMQSGLSLTYPSSAINIYEFLPKFPAGEACLRVAASAKAGDRGEVITYQPKANKINFKVSDFINPVNSVYNSVISLAGVESI